MTNLFSPSWSTCQEIADNPTVHELLQGFSHDSTNDNAVILIKEILALYGTMPEAVEYKKECEELTTYLAEIRDEFADRFPGQSTGLLMNACGGPCEVPAYVKSVLSKLTRDGKDQHDCIPKR
ncbi:MAG TPA: hypothetical protein VFM18_13400 [Methanosarcina sp.]|nr:hypothetical protein [Methanosarcina sp.]